MPLSPEVQWYLESRGIPLPTEYQEPLIQTPEPRDVEGAYFSAERVDHLLRVFHALQHTQGELAGKPLDPDVWQIAYILAPVFGWVRMEGDNEVRIIREVWIEVSRKNGKTTLSGGLAVYLTTADNEPGAQVVAAATTRDQAGYCFRPILSLVENSNLLRKHMKPYRASNKIVHEKSNSYFQSISSVAEAAHGANIHGAVVDEVHLHRNGELIEAIETGTGSRRQPLIVYITTADEGRPNSIYSKKRQMIESLANGTLRNESIYGVIWAAAHSESELNDPFSMEAQRRANPGYGVSPTAGFLKRAAEKAKESPADYASYLRLHLGIRTRQVTRFLPLTDWDESAGQVVENDLKGRPCYGGLDLASVSDIAALCWTFPSEDFKTYSSIWRFWLPEGQLRNLNRRTANEADDWVRSGLLTLTPGDVIDNQAIFDQIDQDAQKFRVISLGYDRWGSTWIIPKLEDEGLNCIALGQGYSTMSGPLKEMLRLVRQHRYSHGGNALMRWMVDNLAVDIDAAGNIKPNKANSADKIDGISAAAMALREATLAAEGGESMVVW
jgi:phage terminase large subunit-like protein